MKLFILWSFLACGAYAASSCGENQSYFECGSPCALTCKNYDNPPLICPAMCVSGCFCDKGYVKTDDRRCVRPEECAGQPEDICSQPVKSGVCLAYFKRFYFDKESGECKEFIYGGCQGNRNNFKTLEECQKTCGVLKQSVSTSDYSQYPDSGNCNAYMPRYYFDNFSGSCKTFMYGGCGGNRNNFRTEEECNAHCLGEYYSRQE